MQKRRTFPVPDTALTGLDGTSARFAYVDRFVPLRLPAGRNRAILQSAAYQAWLTRAPSGNTSRPGNDLEGAQQASDFGVIFKERTRVDPAGFVLGEHVMSLSLGPGEEVTIEQKVFSERQATYEQASEATQELDTELSATFTTELSNQLQEQLSETRQTTFDISGSVGGTIKGVDIAVSPKWSTSLTNADTSTRSDSVRQSSTQSQRVAAKFRTQHKITMKVSETSRFEAATKRVLRNPNAFTPIDLVYFKIMQRLQLSQERYGVRLCWAPFIHDPGAIIDTAIAQAREYFMELYPRATISPEPLRPLQAGKATYVQEIGWPELTEWNDLTGDMRHDYEFELNPNANYEWDGDESFVKNSIEVRFENFGRRGAPTVRVVSAGSNGAGGVRIRIRAGADWGGPGAKIYANAKARFTETSQVVDLAYQTALSQWQVEHADWEQELRAAEEEQLAKVEQAMVEWRKEFWRNFDPVNSAMQLMVSVLFETQMRDEAWEVDAWTTFFELESSAMKLYPSWWSDSPARDPSSGPSSLQNASWARVFLPIRPGYEREALTWLVERRLFTSMAEASNNAVVEGVLAEFEEFRTRHFGGPEELQLESARGRDCDELKRPYLCLGTWYETLPTDGTHLEILQATTSAADDHSETSFDSAQTLIQRRVDLLAHQGNLTDGVFQQVGSTTPDVGVKINVGSSDEPGI